MLAWHLPHYLTKDISHKSYDVLKKLADELQELNMTAR